MNYLSSIRSAGEHLSSSLAHCRAVGTLGSRNAVCSSSPEVRTEILHKKSGLVGFQLDPYPYFDPHSLMFVANSPFLHNHNSRQGVNIRITFTARPQIRPYDDKGTFFLGIPTPNISTFVSRVDYTNKLITITLGTDINENPHERSNFGSVDGQEGGHSF